VDYTEPAVDEKPVPIVNKPKTETAKPKAETTKPKTEPAQTGVVFKVQISSSTNDLETLPKNFKGLDNVSKDKIGNGFKYYYGSTPNYSESKQLLEEAKAKGFTSAFVVAFKDGKKISVQEALK
jgi:N-acetylmuramoyl-L-alanine amidase